MGLKLLPSLVDKCRVGTAFLVKVQAQFKSTTSKLHLWSCLHPNFQQPANLVFLAVNDEIS
jgi:hypothetical protein